MRHRALLDFLKEKGILTQAYQEVLKKRQAAVAVNQALDADQQEREKLLEEMRRELEEDL